MMPISELMTAGPPAVSGDTALGTCALRMVHLGCSHLPVVRPDGRLAGVLTDTAVHRHGRVFEGEFRSNDRNAALTARDLALAADVVATADDDTPSVVRRLARTRQDFAVVVDEREHPIGLVTEHDLLKVALLVVPESLTVDRLPQREVIAFRHLDLAADALDAMVRHGIRHVPVIGPDEVIVGVASYRDIAGASVPPRIADLDDVRSTQVFTASPGDTLVECASRMVEHRVGCLPVVSRGRIVRMVTRRDLVDAAATALEDEGLFEGPLSPEVP